MDTKTVAAGTFKQGCLRILDEVANKSLAVIITKRGKPVAKLVPLDSDEERERAILGKLRHRGKMLVSEKKFLRPTMAEAGWKTLEDET